MAEDEMVRWHHRLNGHRFGWTLGVGDGQGGLVCCGSWGSQARILVCHSLLQYGCESWTIKKAERQRIDVFELCWRRLLRVPWTARRSNQSILKEITLGCSLEKLMLKLKLQYFSHLIRKDLDAGKD